MVDSENTTSLRRVSRRQILTHAAATPALGARVIAPTSATDPILPLWYEWQRIYAYASGLCQLWQAIESQLVHAVGFPQVFIPSVDGGRDIPAQSHAEIDKALSEREYSPDIKASLHAQLTEHQARWNAEAERIGFDEADRQQSKAWDEEAEATKKIFRTRATSLAGVETKIAVIVQLCTTGSDDPDFPLPQLRSTLADISRLRVLSG